VFLISTPLLHVDTIDSTRRRGIQAWGRTDASISEFFPVICVDSLHRRLIEKLPTNSSTRIRVDFYTTQARNRWKVQRITWRLHLSEITECSYSDLRIDGRRVRFYREAVSLVKRYMERFDRDVLYAEIVIVKD